ncbi:hypothetical protein BgiMline_035167, partial [Biomphalaria glabrata]
DFPFFRALFLSFQSTLGKDDHLKSRSWSTATWPVILISGCCVTEIVCFTAGVDKRRS